MFRSLLNASAPMIMGIVNVTPDSFSGDGLGGRANYVEAALDQAAMMIEQGAVWLDIGGESSRPGARPISESEELHRTLPVIEALLERWPDLALSIDTMKPAVAARALEAGVHMINDVSGATMDPKMFDLAKEHNAALVLMHNQAHEKQFTQDERLGSAYDSPNPEADIVAHVVAELQDLIARALTAGVPPRNLVLDPGLGFGKNVAQNLALVNNLDRITGLGYPILLAPSRKNFIGQVLDLPPEDRKAGTAAVVAIGTYLGAKILRVHDVKDMSQILKMTQALRQAPRFHA